MSRGNVLDLARCGKHPDTCRPCLGRGFIPDEGPTDADLPCPRCSTTGWRAGTAAYYGALTFAAVLREFDR